MDNKIKIFFGIAIVFVVVIGLVYIYPTKENQQNNQSGTNTSNSTEPITEISNPAGFYCHDLGYKTRINETPEGQEGICIFPDGSECDDWSFYAGLCGQKWSYCELNGYGLKTKTDGKDSYSIYYSVCIDKNTNEEIGSISKLLNFTQKFNSGRTNSSPTG
jgi:putative hemolysin